ncbi:exocyst complex component, exo70 subunit [Mycena rosella]|uniref:Exocyst complex protein EXO70 n=1 Tax=Mycena rosella TaxID=1033263 RepID=A0AAD7GRV5_MYCRO|nr:exocyst complex component, exo70 subunit [Mycena rosella]
MFGSDPADQYPSLFRPLHSARFLDMDDETAEIELLEQNLNKTRQISQRMTSILNSFDTRLAKLEKSILPLYTSTQMLNRRASNIEKALLKIDEVASNQEGIAAEEALILRGPQPGQLSVYQEALERLNASIAFKSSDRDSLDTARLVETGAKKLTQLYTKLVAEASTGSTPPPNTEVSAAPFPSAILNTLRPLVVFMRTLPLPASHPSHAAAPAILSTLKDAQRGYADMRGTWSRKCLEAQGKRVVDRADTVDSIVAGKEFARWVESLMSVADEEYKLIKELSPLSIPNAVASSYNALLNPLLALFSTTLTSLIAFIKRALHKHAFLALAAYEALGGLSPRWDTLLARRGSENAKANELKDGLGTLRAVCLRSFPEFLADIKMASLAGGAGKGASDTATGVADFVVSAVKYMDRLPEVHGAASAALLQLGDGNWKMGEGVQVGKGSKLGDGDEQVILEHFVYDVVTTTISSLTTISRTQKRPAHGSMYLLNNMAYLQHYTLDAPAHDALLDLLSKPTQAALTSGMRTARAAYFDANFSPLLQTLTDDPSAKGAKAAAKEKFTKFYELLDEVLERHRGARILEDDDETREAIGEDVVKLVVPSLVRFTNKYREKEFSKNPQKYIKQSSEAVEAQLKAIYR